MPRLDDPASAAKMSSDYTPPLPRATTTRPSRLARVAKAIRDGFDVVTGFGPHAWRFSLPPAVWAALLSALALGLGSFVTSAIPVTCTVRPIRLEVTFSATRFQQLLAPLDICAGPLNTAFLRDIPFCIVYPFALAVLFLWAERWRRFEHQAGAPDAPRDSEQRPIHDFLIVAPFIAAALDIFVEDFPLWLAGGTVSSTRPMPAWAGAAIWVGSLGAAVKWTLLFVFTCGLFIELLSGPRGVLLRRLRFSLLAVLLGAIPLAATDPGLDILQRVVEPPHAGGHLAFAIAWLVFSATAVWYCGRRLVQLDFLDAGARLHLARDEQWRGKPWYRFFAAHLPRIFGIAMLVGAAVGFARAGLALGAFGLWTGASIVVVTIIELVGRRQDPTDALARANRIFWRRVLEAIVATAIVAALLLPIWRPEGTSGEITTAMWYHRIAAAVLVGLAWVFYLFVYYRRERKAARGTTDPKKYLAKLDVAKDEAIESGSARDIASELRTKALLATIASVIMLVLFTLDPVGVARPLGALGVLALFAANTVFFGSVFVWVYDRFRVPIVRIGLGLAVVFGNWNENHDVPLIHDRSGGIPAPARVSFDSQFTRWLGARLQEDRPDTARVPVFLVAAAGGGLRAAYWTAAVLARAQDAKPDFSKHVFAISGVSGGSLGAAVFAALVRDAGPDVGTLPCSTDSTSGGARTDTSHAKFTRCVHRFMERDFLSPVLSRLIAPDLAQRFLPMPVLAFDRSTALEESWSASYFDVTGDDTFRQGLSALAAERAGLPAPPTLFLNSTHVSSGKRYVASSVLTDPALADQGDVLGLVKADVPLASAVHNSARFPYVSPAGHLVHDGNDYGRVVDGGYFENSGLLTLREIYQGIMKQSSRITPIVVYLCNDPIPCARDIRENTDSTVKPTLLNELLSPVRALLNTRDARGSLARSDFVRDGVRFLQFNVCDELQGTDATARPDTSPTAKLQRDRVVSPPLSWLLSDLARDWMDQSLVGDPSSASACVKHNLEQLDTITAALGGATGTPHK